LPVTEYRYKGFRVLLLLLVLAVTLTSLAFLVVYVII
jgi:hypothetical protein